MVGDEREHALEGDDGLVDAPGVERGDAEEIVEFRHAGHLVLHRGELGVGLLRVARGEEAARALERLLVRDGCQRCKGGENGGNSHPA